MSYDIQVYVRLALDHEGLRELVREAGLDVEATTSQSLTVVRGVKAQYTCTLSLPAAVESEDIPDEVVGLLLAPSFVYDLQVEGSSAVAIPHAVRLARRLAQATEGVVLDQQTGQTWSPGKLRISPGVSTASSMSCSCGGIGKPSTARLRAGWSSRGATFQRPCRVASGPSSRCLSSRPRKVECARRFFASLNVKAKNDGVRYDVVDTFDSLLQLVQG